MVHRHAGAETDGTPCWYDVVREHTEIPADAERYIGVGMFIVVEYPPGWWDGATTQLGHSPRECVDGPGAPAPPTPGDINDALEDLVPAELPAPSLSVDPGEVLTGLPAYLEAQWDDEPAPVDSDCDAAADTPARLVVEDDDDGCNTLRDDVRLHLGNLQLVLGPYDFDVQLDAVARYEVDWGDGATDDVRVEGEPYPDGIVQHTYQSVTEDGEVTLSIQEYWTVTWTIEGYGTVTMPGELDPPPTTVSVPIRQMQAVVTSTS